MILEKLKEALSEIPLERKRLDDLESQLRSMIQDFLGKSIGTTIQASVPPMAYRVNENGGKDRNDQIVEILRAAGKPLHITLIAAALSEINDSKVTRQLIEPGLNRHIAKTKHLKIVKMGPSIFGLPEWKQNGSISNTMEL